MLRSVVQVHPSPPNIADFSVSYVRRQGNSRDVLLVEKVEIGCQNPKVRLGSRKMSRFKFQFVSKFNLGFATMTLVTMHRNYQAFRQVSAALF